MSSMTELIVDQHNTDTLSTTDNNHRLFSESFLIKVSQCIEISNTIRADYGIDVLETNGNFDITDRIVDRLNSLSATYFQNVNRNTNHIDTFSDLSERQKSTVFDNNFDSIISTIIDNEKIIKEPFPIEVPSIPIKLPTIIEIQLRNNRVLRNAINTHRRSERYSNLSKIRKTSLMKIPDEEDLLTIDTEPLCPTELHDISPKVQVNLTSLMKQIHNQCQNQKKTKLTGNIEAIVEHIINEEILYEYLQNQIKINSQQTRLQQSRRKNKKNHHRIIPILPYENTYQQFYYPDQFISIEKSMIDKIINGVQAMAMTLTNTKDIEDVLNGTMMLTDPSSSPLAEQSNNKITDELMNTIQKRLMTRKQPYTTNFERIQLRMALNLILVDNRLNGTTILCRSKSLILSCMLRKIRLCIQIRTLCSYGDVITTINEIDSQQIHLRTFKRMSLSFDEFIEILGEIYHTSLDTIETMKYYFEANDIIDMNTNLIHRSILKSKEIDEITKYILHEDAIRELRKLIFNRKQNNEYIQLKLVLPMKLNELYQPIKKLNAFMSPMQVMTAIRRPYLSQLIQRSKIKAITASDLRAITSQIWLSSEDFDGLIAEKTITSEILSRFYMDFHEKDDIDERLIKIQKKIFDYSNMHSCITRVVLKMLAEHSNGTILTPFLNEFNKTPRLISIIDLFDDLLQSGLISTTELILYSKQDIIIKKSSLLKHFERISFFRKRDADYLAEINLVIREDNLINYLIQRAQIMKQEYINCILNTDERRNFITKNILQSTKRLSSVSIHQFIHYFNLDPNCGKIFYWMGLTDENIVKTLIETKNFVNEYTLDGIYNNFLTRLHDTLESGIYFVSTENLIDAKSRLIPQRINEDLCKLGCYLTYEQASILVDFADPQYEKELLSLITIHDVISQERLKTLLKSNKFNDLSKEILHKQQVIECQILLDSFYQRIIYRKKRFERIENLQKLLLSSQLFEQFIDIIPDLGFEYFTRLELDHLEQIKLIDIGVLAILLTLPSYNPLIHQHKYEWFHEMDTSQISDIVSNYLHILDPIIEKYSIFLTIIILRILSNRERFSTINEILLFNSDYYLSTEEVLKICIHEQILSHDDLLRICRETFPTTSSTSDLHSQDKTDGGLDSEVSGTTPQSSIPDCYTRNMSMYTRNSILQKTFEKKIILAIFDCILHFNHRNLINGQLQQLFNVFKPLSIYTAQLLIEKEMIIIKLLLQTRKDQSGKLTINDLNRYLEFYPIPCRLDILNELRRLKLISQSLTNIYTLNQCHELKSATPESQVIFLFYMMIKLIRKEGYIDENNLEKFLHQYETTSNLEKFHFISKQILREGFLTIEQIVQSTKDFFLQDYLIENPSSEFKNVIEEQILTKILHREQLTNTQLTFALSQNMRRREVVQINHYGIQLNSLKLAKEKVQRKVDNVLSKMDENITSKSSRFISGSLAQQQQISSDHPESSPNLRSLRHHYIQAKIPRNQLNLLVEQGGWNNEIYLQFKHELDIIDSDNSLELIQHITRNISLLLKENGSIGEQPLNKYFQYHQNLFLADFELLLTRYGMIELDDLIDLLIISKLARKEEIECYAKRIFCLNVNKFMEIFKSQDDILVKRNHVQNNLEKRLCVTSVDLSQLLNQVLKLDRLKRIINLMPTIENYIRLHPINTFNAVKALKLEFDFNHYDMKFLRDLKVLNETWYKRYLLSRTSETGPIVSEIIDEEHEQEDRQEFKFRSSTEDDFDLEAFNQLFETKKSQTAMNEQRKQAYITQIKKRKDQIDTKISTDDDQLQFSLNLDDIQKQKGLEKDQLRVIEQFFPDASILGPQLRVPDNQKRIFMQLDFAKEENIDDYYKQLEENERDQRNDVRRQTIQYRDTLREEKPSISDIQPDEEKKELSISKIPSIEKTILTEEEKGDIEDQTKEVSEKMSEQQLENTQSIIVQPSVEKHPLEIKKSPSSSKEDRIESKSSKENIVDQTDELSKPSIQTLPSDKILSIDERLSSSKSISIVPSNTTKDLTPDLTELFQQMADIDRNSLKRNLKLLRLNIDQWLQQTLQHNEQIKSIDHQSIIENESLTNQLNTYLHHELNIFDKNFISLILNKYFKNLELTNLFQQRLNHIKNILQEMKDHQEIIKQIIEIDQIIDNIKNDRENEDIFKKYYQYKEEFNQIKNREYAEVQPILGIRLELAIRTLDADLQFIEQILDGKTLTDIMPNISFIATESSRQPVPSIESQIYEDITLIRDNLSSIAMEINKHRSTTSEKTIIQDLLKIDIAERLQAIKNEYSEQKLNEEKIQNIKINIDQLAKLDPYQTEFIDKIKQIHNLLNISSNQIQKNLSKIISARYQSDYPNISLNAKLKFLPVDISGNVIEPSLYLVNDQNIPISDELQLIRLPCESDQFHISNDKCQLIIVDKNQIPLSNPITFQQLTSGSIEFEYANDDQRSVRIVETSSHKSMMLNVKPISSNQPSANQVLFIVDDYDRPISKPIQLLDHTTSEFNLATFLYDEKTNEKILLTPEQYLIARQQAEFTSRKFVTYIVDKNKIPISEPIQISDSGIQMRHSIENIISNKLDFFDYQLSNRLISSEDISYQYKLMNGYIQDRIDRLKIEEKVIEYIIPILDNQHDDLFTTDQLEYKREQSNMDYLLHTMKSIVHLDEKLTEYRKTKSNDSTEIQTLENNLIHQLIEISTHLDDPMIPKQVQNLTDIKQFRSIILSGIKIRAKTIEKNCETLLINIYEKSNQLKQSEQIRSEYIQYFTKRFTEEIEHQKNIENLYEKIERMQYDHYQKMTDSLETIELEDLDNIIRNQIPIPDYLKTKNEKLIYKFNFILRFLQDELTTIEQYKKDLINELERFIIPQSIHNENSSIQQIIFLQNEIKINKNEKLLKYIEKLKVLLNKLETITKTNLQYDFLFSKLDRLYEIFSTNYQIDLPIETNIESIRQVLNHSRKKTTKQLEEFDRIKMNLLQKLEVLKKKEELKQRTKIISITEDSSLGLLNAYIQQSNIEPINIHHEFYAMKIQQIIKNFISIFHTRTFEQQLSLMNSLNKTMDHLKNYNQDLDRQKIVYENKFKSIEEISITREYSMVDSLVRERVEDLIRQQKKLIRQREWIIQMKTISNEIFNQLQTLFIHNSERDDSHELFKQFKQRAMETIIQSTEYQRLSKRVSLQLLLLNRITSGQELIPLVAPSSCNLFQLAIKTEIQQELPSPIFLVQNQTSAIYQKDFTEQIASLNPKTQILQIEINYLQRQHAEAIAIGDLTQQLAAERAIANKLQTIKHLQDQQKLDQTEISNQSKTSIVSSVISEKSLVDQQIRGLLKKHLKPIQKLIRNDQKESLSKEIIHSVEDLRRLNNELKKSRRENNRQKQVDIQLEILDKIDQLDQESVDQDILKNLRQHLQEEQEQQGLLIDSSNELLRQEFQTQILPISPHVLESAFTISTEEKKSDSVPKQMIIPVMGEVLAPMDSKERMNISLAMTDAKELYQELQKMRNSIDIAFKNTQIPSDVVDSQSPPRVSMPVQSSISIEHSEASINTIRLPSQNRRESNSIVSMNSSLFPPNTILDSKVISSPDEFDLTTSHEEQSSPLLVVGNAKKYSITQTQAKHQQTAIPTQRSIFHSRRDYGEVYVRHKLVGIADSTTNLDEEREQARRKLREKIQRKIRLVKFEKTKQGSTVIHRPVDLSTRVFIVPQQANYEENLELASPLIHVKNVTQSTLDEITPLTSQRSSTDNHQSQKSQLMSPLHSISALSPIEEESEEMETTNGIAFSLTNRDSSIKRHFVETDDKLSNILTIDDSEKPSEKLKTLQKPPITASHASQLVNTTQQQKIGENKYTTIGTLPSFSLPDDLLSTSIDSQKDDPIKTPISKKLKTIKKKSSKKKSEPTEDAQLITTTTTYDDSISTQGFDIEQDIQQPIPITPESTVIYHKFGGKLKSGKKKKKSKKIKTSSEPEPLVFVPRKAVPFISATKDKQIDVEDNVPIKHKKKKRKRSTKSKRFRSSSRSKSTTRKRKKSKRRPEKQLNIDDKTVNDLIETKSIKNKDAIAMHLLDVKRFTGPPISALNFDQSRSKYDDIIEIPNKKIEQARLNFLKPMLKNFDIDDNLHQRQNKFQNIDAYDLDRELFDFNIDTKDIDQPAIFTEYIPDFFQKQAEEKQIRRISLTAIRTNEQLTKRLAPRVSRLYHGYQPSNQPCAHTDEFRPLNKYLMSDISFYFDDDFIDHTGLFQSQKSFDKIQPQIKQPTQRFRDDYIVKEFFNCWNDYATEKARIAELRRKRVIIDFREFWFQDAFSDPFYSYFEQPIDYQKKQNNQHQMAYRLHKRLVRTGREQPKETMHGINRSSFLPVLFNLPKNNLDRQGSLTRRRQFIEDNSIPLSNLITHSDDVLPLIRERLNRTKIQINRSHDELAIKQLLLKSSLLEQGTIQDLDRLITDYFVDQQSGNVVKLPMIKQSSNRLLSMSE